MHHEFRRETGADSVVLFVHGIQGSPSQFSWLIESLPEQVDFVALMLPGHGSGVRGFACSTSRGWLKYICKEAYEAQRKHKKIYLVGHSMGCLLGMLACLDGGICFDGMLLLACPLSLRPRLRYFVNAWKAIRQKAPEDPWVIAAKEANSVETRCLLSYLCCVGPYLGLFRLIYIIRRRMHQLNAPVIAVHSKKDEIVGDKSMEILRKSSCAKVITLSDSGHFYYPIHDRRQLSELLLAMIE